MKPKSVTPDEVEFCRRVTNRLVSDMEGMRDSTEAAALRIGELLISIVDTATKGNDELKDSLRRFVRCDGQADSECETERQSETIVEAIDRQTRLIRDMIGSVQECFRKQAELSVTANKASRRIAQTARKTCQLMTRSKFLALNVQIEANRLGGAGGRSVSVLGEEMKHFSEDVEAANKIIEESIMDFVQEMPKLEEETRLIGERLAGFKGCFESEMEDIRRETQSVTSLLAGVLDETESRNNQILKFSHDTLSHLQFQDPVSQGLQRAEHEVQKLCNLFEGNETVDDALADIAEEVGHDGTEETQAGEILMF